MPVRSTLPDTFEDRTSEYTSCRPVLQQVIGSASQSSSTHSSSQELIIVIEEGREYYVPPSTRKKRSKHVGSDISPIDNGSRESVMDLRPQARSSTKADVTISQDYTSSIRVTENHPESSAAVSRPDSRLSGDQRNQPFCSPLASIGMSMDGTPRSSSSSSLPHPAVPVNGPTAVERMMARDLRHLTRIDQYTSNPIDAANMEPTFHTYPFSAMMSASGQAPVNYFHYPGGIVEPPFFIPATPGEDLQAHGGGLLDMQRPTQGIRSFDHHLETPSSFSDLAALDVCACGIVFDTQRGGALGRLWRPLVDTLCDRRHLIYMLAQLGGTQTSSMDYYGNFNVMAPSTAYSGFAGDPNIPESGPFSR